MGNTSGREFSGTEVYKLPPEVVLEDTDTDVTGSIEKQITIVHCPRCDCYLRPPATWIKAQLESKEFLMICVKTLKNWNKTRPSRAEIVGVEEDSKLVKVKLTLNKNICDALTLVDSCIVECTIQDEMCKNCSCSGDNVSGGVVTNSI